MVELFAQCSADLTPLCFFATIQLPVLSRIVTLFLLIKTLPSKHRLGKGGGSNESSGSAQNFMLLPLVSL
ncbi:hypothetical protein [Pseudomonas syringae group genomosp. 7]|uniref:hypothetical protein n=1 Tax=Pseudomonas syringae group genomosp. 7 TaxID=251699 RepID=UPI000A7FECD7|nr:hypothetical protein [Pseudomonas syringae group genomosp. 7]UNB65060.1 hypothetical protein MME54_09950 [Pseudomonas syringae pv. helianthi]